MPRWVLGAFAAIALLGSFAALTVFAVLYREAEDGHLTISMAVTLLVVSYVILALVSIVVFRQVALPPVAAQTAELASALERQLEVNRRQQDFLVHVHHELRTPVTIVRGATQLLAAHGDDLDHDERWRLREAAARNAEALAHLVEDLTRGVDEALPGMASTGHVDNWSSTRARRLAASTEAGDRTAVG